MCVKILLIYNSQCIQCTDVESNGTTLDPGSGSQFWGTQVNGASKVKSNAWVATNKNFMHKFFLRGG